MAAHRYWRINMTAGAAAAFAFAGIQFRTAAGSSLAFSGGTASAADTYGGAPGTYDASKAADIDVNTLYSSNNKTAPQWWAYDFGSGNSRDVVEIAITARNDANYNQAPSGFTPQWSDDGTNWTSMQGVATAVWTSAAQVQALAVTPEVPLTKTVWSTTDKANIVLANRNLAAGPGDFHESGVRAEGQRSTGKYYWEYTCFWTSAQTNVGVANLSASLTGTVGGFPTNNAAVVWQSGGNIWVNSAQPSGTPALGTRASGDIIGVAIDLDNKLIWFRVAPSGNWNGSGTANPATTTGGVSISAISTPVCPLFATYTFANADSVVANFGDSTFSGAVPSGFASGFPPGVSSPVTNFSARFV